MQRLRVLHVAREVIEPVEEIVGGIVPAGSELLLLGLGVEVFAAIAEAGQGGGDRYGYAG